MKIEMSDEDALAAINKPPSFESQIQKTFIIEHVKQADGKIEDTSVFKYTSSKAIDPENDKVQMSFNTGGRKFISLQ